MIHHTQAVGAARVARWPEIEAIAFCTRDQSVCYLYPHHLGREIRQSAETTNIFNSRGGRFGG